MFVIYTNSINRRVSRNLETPGTGYPVSDCPPHSGIHQIRKQTGAEFECSQPYFPRGTG